MPQPWPWVKVMERSSSTIPQTHIFFVPNIKGLAQTVLTWEGKVFADAAETDWKHKVTPEWGDLMCYWTVFLAATKQLNEWYFLSVCLSHLFDYVPIIVSSWNFQELSLGTRVRSMQKVKVTAQLNRFRTVTPVWIHIWWWNDTYSLMLLRRGALLFLKVIRQFSRSHGSKNRQIWPR